MLIKTEQNFMNIETNLVMAIKRNLSIVVFHIENPIQYFLI